MTGDAAPTKAQAKAARLKARKRFQRARIAEKKYASQLKGVAKQVGVIVKGFAPKGVVNNMSELSATLGKYAELIVPWAKRVAGRMLAEVDQRDVHAWAEAGREMGLALKEEVKKAQTGEDMRQLLDYQVDLISSLPLKAAQRVHRLTIEAQSSGTRAAEIAEEILKSGHVTESRAMLIARTEVARTSSVLTQARAEHIGSEGYIWRTVGDSDVREVHRKLEGKFIKWDDPPIAGENGERAHAGCIYNCRCYPEPVIPEYV